MGILDVVKNVRDRNRPTLDEISPFADEEFDATTEPDGDDSRVPEITKAEANG